MSANTTIEWATKSWNPVRGCSRVSSGCDHCYAMGQAHRFAGPGKPYEGLTTIRKGKVDWSGVARFIPPALDEPLRWRKPERIFVNSMSDLFHHSITFERIAAVFGVMAACPRHTFLVLTKRPARALEFFSRVAPNGHPGPWIRNNWKAIRELYAAGSRFGTYRGVRHRTRDDAGSKVLNSAAIQWSGPLHNVHLGVSCENQATADERTPLLLQCPAAVRWVSAEPLIGPIEFNRNGRHLLGPAAQALGMNDGIGWVVVGGESGPGARPLDLAWTRSIVHQCADVDVPCFVKQFGRLVVDSERQAGSFAEYDKRSIAAAAALDCEDNPPNLVVLRHRKGADLSQIPGNWPREFPST